MGILQAKILEWAAMLSSRGSSQPRPPTLQADSLLSEPPGKPIPSPGDLPSPGIEPGSPALQADSLPAELTGKPIMEIFVLLGYINGNGILRYV